MPSSLGRAVLCRPCYAHHSTAACCAIQLGQDDAAQLHRLIELLGLRERQTQRAASSAASKAQFIRLELRARAAPHHPRAEPRTDCAPAERMQAC